eukprot:GHRQ01008239.1.p1 GENE.GHRQ01008239.1~~GHRQ01008239.1.p1  ORF type:complete len:474 (+),score=250.32 GHRQ01008239.1:231-1652(+)
MNWLAEVGNLLVGEPAVPSKEEQGNSIQVFATSSSSEKCSEEGTEGAAALVNSAEDDLASLNLGCTDSRDGYLAEVSKVLLQPSKVSKYMGMDVTSLMSVPLFIMEPFSMLQKMAEIMEYTQLLDDADKSDDRFERLALVAAFLVSPFGAAERTWKPFNPLLGETFELEGLGSGVRFMAEQVCEQPPVSAAHAENEHFTYDIVSAPATKFQGNSLEVYPKGRTRIGLRRSGEVFSHVPPQAKVHNLVLGRTWVDSYGSFLVTNTASGDKVALEFKPCGWFGAGQHEFDGHVVDAEGNAKFAMSGKWNSHVDMCACNPDGTPAADAPLRRLWTCAAKPEEDHYGCTHFAWHLNSTKYLSRPPLASDSRRRADRQALQERKMTEAAAAKQAIDTQQQEQHKELQQRGEQWQARWFEPAPDMQVLPGEEPAEVVPLWRWNGRYSSTRDSMPAGSDDWPEGVMGQGFAISQRLALEQ